MEIHKRFGVMIMSFVLVAAMIVGCGQKEIVSDISIDEFETKVVKVIDNAGSLTTTETDDGYKFVFDRYGEDQSWFSGIERFEGTANKDRMIKSVTAFRENVDTEYFMEMTAEQFVSDIMDYENVSARKIYGELFIVDFGNAVGLFSPDTESDDQLVPGLKVLMNARKSPQKINGWQYTIETNAEAGTVTIKAEYVGK